MKHKRFSLLSCCVAMLLAAGATQTLNAFTYIDGDLLLLFRKSTFNDIEFNLGSVSNYLGLANGTVRNVTNFNLTLLSSNFNNNLSGVTVTMLAATTTTDASRRGWVTDPDASQARQDVAGSRLNTTWSKVNGMGAAAMQVTVASTSQVYIVSAGDPSSYTYIASTGGANDPSTLSGAVLFQVDGQIAVTLRFWELHVSNVTPKPDATQVGSFTIGANGAITFTAGSGGGTCTPPNISSGPANATVFAGGPASFSVTASGATGYQWQHNGGNILGATGASYGLTAHSADAGDYRVIASNGSCSSTSGVATLTVNLPAAAGLGQFSKSGSTFSLKLTGTASAYYEVQSNTNLNNTNAWATIGIITNSGGMTTFNDPNATNSSRFYRAIAR